MIIKEAAPTLTCVATADGFQYELLLSAPLDQPTVTKVRVGPYFFKPEYQPRNTFMGVMSGGPENGFWLHKSTPRGWSRWNWQVDESQPDSPAYIVSTGALSPGQQGLFKFISKYAPGGLRAGLEIFRGDQHTDYGVTGPNYEPCEATEHPH